jgi:tRNA(fMet)-specific endonuclease VapC
MVSASDRYLLDTNIWSALIRRSSLALVDKFNTLERTRILLSPIVLGELQVGYFKGDRSAKRLRVLDYIIANAELLTVDHEVCRSYGKLRADLETAGTPIGPNDTWIAAEAMRHKLTLVTDNVREFQRVPKLKVENWL